MEIALSCEPRQNESSKIILSCPKIALHQAMMGRLGRMAVHPGVHRAATQPLAASTTVTDRRFFAQHSVLEQISTGRSRPKLTARIRVAGTPLLAR